jgi:integrase
LVETLVGMWTKACKKSDRQRRRVPLREKVLEVLDQHPRRLARLVSPVKDGDYLKLGTFYLRHWRPALRAAGVEPRGVYACRHTFAAWSMRGRRPALLPESDHGDVSDANRRDLSAPRSRL